MAQSSNEGVDGARFDACSSLASLWLAGCGSTGRVDMNAQWHARFRSYWPLPRSALSS